MERVAGGVVHAARDEAAVGMMLEERRADGRDGHELLGVDAIEEREAERLRRVVEIDDGRAGAVVDDEIVGHGEEDRARGGEAVRRRQRGRQLRQVLLDVGVERQRRHQVQLAVVAEKRIRGPRHGARIAFGDLHLRFRSRRTGASIAQTTRTSAKNNWLNHLPIDAYCTIA